MLHAIALALTVSPLTQAISEPSAQSIDDATLRRDALNVADLDEKFNQGLFSIENQNEQLAEDIKSKISSLMLSTPKSSFLQAIDCQLPYSIPNTAKTYCICQAPYSFDPTDPPGNCGLVCSNRGTLLEDGKTCRCTKAGYAGVICNDCADGYYRKDAYSCLPSPCPANALLVSLPDKCICKAGYYGDRLALTKCTACNQGYFSAAGSLSCQSCGSTVAQVFASNPAGSTETCTCQTGYAGSPCTLVCDATLNLVANAANNACVCRSGYSSYPADAGNCNLICSNNGQLDSTGSACICNPGYTGSLCDTCDAGYAGSQPGLCDICATGYAGSPCAMTPAKLFDTLCAGSTLVGSIDGATELQAAEVIVKSWCP